MFNHALIIDSSPSDTQDIKKKLLELGIKKVLTAGRITIGLEELATRRKDPIDLILLDIDQPDSKDTDGVIKIRLSPSTKNIPLVVLSNAVRPDTMFACLRAGADEFVGKIVFFSKKMSKILTMAYERRKVRTTSRSRPRIRMRLR